jgi:hypothetical protein
MRSRDKYLNASASDQIGNLAGFALGEEQRSGRRQQPIDGVRYHRPQSVLPPSDHEVFHAKD